jgi:hypothetical protein
VTPSKNETNRIENRVEAQVAGLTRREARTACVATAVGAAALPLASGQEAASVGTAQPAIDSSTRPQTYGESCIEVWDPGQKGWLEEPHHSTYDAEFWGPDSMCTSFYLAALRAVELMGRALGEDVSRYTAILERGRRRAEEELFNGEYFSQKIEWKNLQAKNPLDISTMVGVYSPEARTLLEQEGPKYPYSTELGSRCSSRVRASSRAKRSSQGMEALTSTSSSSTRCDLCAQASPGWARWYLGGDAPE